MSIQHYGPFREIVIDCPVHQRCIGNLLEEAAERVLARDYLRCVCADCVPDQIVVEAWHLYWASLK